MAAGWALFALLVLFCFVDLISHFPMSTSISGVAPSSTVVCTVHMRNQRWSSIFPFSFSNHIVQAAHIVIIIIDSVNGFSQQAVDMASIDHIIGHCPTAPPGCQGQDGVASIRCLTIGARQQADKLSSQHTRAYFAPHDDLGAMQQSLKLFLHCVEYSRASNRAFPSQSTPHNDSPSV